VYVRTCMCVLDRGRHGTDGAECLASGWRLGLGCLEEEDWRFRVGVERVCLGHALQVSDGIEKWKAVQVRPDVDRHRTREFSKASWD